MIQRIYNKILFDGQAYLYATLLKFQKEAKGEVVTEEEFTTWQDEWKMETRELVNEIVEKTGEEDEETSNNS
jgi:hypothetical protein